MFDCPADAKELDGGARVARKILVKRVVWFGLSFLLSLLTVVLLQERSGSHHAELSAYPDEAAHYITGLMIRGYLRQSHWGSPIRFAENYYLHYPKVAIGHWPPVFYLAQCLWTLVFTTSISSILYLQAVLLAVTSAILFTIANRRFGPWIALILCGIFLVLRSTQELGSEVMSEPLLALVTIGATWSIGRYFETARPASLAGFVLLVELAAHTKGSGLALVGVPVILAFCMGRYDVLRKRTFWFAQLIMILVLIPWQILTWKMVINGTDGPAGLRLFFTQAHEFGQILVDMLGWPLLLLLLCGGSVAIMSRTHRDPLLASCSVTAALTLAFHCISPSGAEDRRLFMAIPGVLLLAPLPFVYLSKICPKMPLAAFLLFIISATSLITTRLAFHKTAVGYRRSAEWLLANVEPGENAVLVDSEIDGEGMLISEIGQCQPIPSLYIVRSSKLFEDCDWQAHDCQSIISDPSRAEQVLDSMPVRYVVIDRFPGLGDATRHELLKRMLVANSDLWRLRDTQPATAPGSVVRGEILIYERAGINQTRQVHVSVNLRRMIGRVIGDAMR